MRWKDYKLWFRGAIYGLIASLFISAGLFTNIYLLSSLANIGLYFCYLITQCSGKICSGCIVMGLIFNLIIGFIVGSIIGGILEKYFRGKKRKSKNGKKR